MPTTFTLHIPATTANLGAGFDCLGLALALYNTVRVEPAHSLSVHIEGEGIDTLARTASNRVVRAMQTACDAMDRQLPPISIHMTNRIPLARGLGSSAAAAVGGLLAANHFYGAPLSGAELLRLAARIEGHPDNVAPALLGGFCVASMNGEQPVVVQFPVPEAVRVIVFVPETPLSTRQARAVLPYKVKREDAVFNLGRTALWVAALTQQRFELLSLATQDRLHQPYRARLIAGCAAIMDAALGAGARGAWISGAGSSIAAFADASTPAIAEAMQRAAQAAGQGGRTLELACAQQGARLEEPCT